MNQHLLPFVVVGVWTMTMELLKLESEAEDDAPATSTSPAVPSDASPFRLHHLHSKTFSSTASTSSSTGPAGSAASAVEGMIDDGGGIKPAASSSFTPPMSSTTGSIHHSATDSNHLPSSENYGEEDFVDAPATSFGGAADNAEAAAAVAVDTNYYVKAAPNAAFRTSSLSPSTSKCLGVGAKPKGRQGGGGGGGGEGGGGGGGGDASKLELAPVVSRESTSSERLLVRFLK